MDGIMGGTRGLQCRGVMSTAVLLIVLAVLVVTAPAASAVGGAGGFAFAAAVEGYDRRAS